MLTEVPFLDHGLVRLRDVMGDDLTVVNAARVSFNDKSDWETWHPGPKQLSKKDKRLIHFLAEGGHWSPFSHPQLSLEVYVPGMVIDQLVKHRIGMSFGDEAAYMAWENAGDNQLSMRYKEPQHFYIPTAWREAPENKKQGSGPGFVGAKDQFTATESMKIAVKRSEANYRWALEQGIAPEQARVFLPFYAVYTRRYWTSSLMGIIRFLELREKADAQYEIRMLANAVHQLVEPRFPESFAAYGLTTGA
jgi:thymidylate synthase (FAD)